MSAEPTLLFCVGATKAGTSWLYRHLRDHPDCHLRGIKELHYFDMIENGTFTRNIRKLRPLAVRPDPGMADARSAAKAADAAALLHVLLRRTEDVPRYLSYLTAGANGRRLVADITPAYATLPVNRLRQMASITGDVRFLYLLRDPLARLWSHVRMLAARATATLADLPAVARTILGRVLAGGEAAVAARGDYAGAVGRLRAAVAPENLAVMVQEEVMTPSGLPRLWLFLGIGDGPVRLDRRVHAGVDVPIDADQAAAARNWLAPQYAFVEAMFGRLPQGWQNPVSGVRA